MCLLFRIYQTRTTSLHAHPGVKHKNGRAYNDKAGGISRTQKAYDCRDIVWTKKYRICIRVTSECGKNLPDDLGQHGGNWIEWTHSAMKLSFKQNQTQPVFWDYIPSTQVKLLFSIIHKTTIKLTNKLKKCNGRSWTNEHKRIVEEIKNLYEDYISLKIFSGVSVDDFNHAIVYFENIDRTLQTWYRGINHDTCIKHVTSLNSLDYSHLLWVIYNSAETHYGDFDDVKFILNSDKICRNLQRQVHWRMTIDEIKQFIHKEWNSDFNQDLHYFFDNADANDDKDYEIGKNNTINTYVYSLERSLRKHMLLLLCFVHVYIVVTQCLITHHIN